MEKQVEQEGKAMHCLSMSVKHRDRHVRSKKRQDKNLMTACAKLNGGMQS